ncbi:MAG: DUF1987 domain-containing protein, partial [Flavobacteriales bacterium]|nr:DUF1987 domain-containing protein [Flavobacteriales bacterium]
MNALLIERKLNTPLIDFNPNTGLLKIEGRSIPENPIKFYQPIEGWISNFIKTNPKDLILSIHLDYLNTHSTECVLILMKKLEAFYKIQNTNVKVSWNYDEEDEDM